MTKKQRVALWRRMSQCFDRHERTMIRQEKKKMKSRMDIIGQNGNTGEHYEELNRGNWWGLADDWEDEDPLAEIKRQQDAAEPGMFRYTGANYTGRNPEPDATSMDDDLPSAAEDCAKQRGSYEI
tara:strand:+ start:697 stop:1071 length:375 start_codon:yes stop_codon:yes gene_type:complete